MQDWGMRGIAKKENSGTNYNGWFCESPPPPNKGIELLKTR